MKKTVLGKITFILLCVVTIIFIATKSYVAWYTIESFRGWEVFNELLDTVSDTGAFTMMSEIFYIPIMWSIMCIIYVVCVAKNKKVNKVLYVVTALAILADTIIYNRVLKRNDYVEIDNTGISQIPLYVRIGFLLAIIILFIGINKRCFHIVLGGILGCSLMGTLVYMVVWYKNNMAELAESFFAVKDEAYVFWFGEYFAIPILGFLLGVLLIGYILFPTRYIEEK